MKYRGAGSLLLAYLTACGVPAPNPNISSDAPPKLWGRFRRIPNPSNPQNELTS